MCACRVLMVMRGGCWWSCMVGVGGHAWWVSVVMRGGCWWSCVVGVGGHACMASVVIRGAWGGRGKRGGRVQDAGSGQCGVGSMPRGETM